MSLKEDSKTLASLIMQQTGKATLDAGTTADILGLSIKTLEKDRQDGIGIPYTRLNGKEKGKPLYSVLDIAKHIEENKIKTLN